MARKSVNKEEVELKEDPKKIKKEIDEYVKEKETELYENVSQKIDDKIEKAVVSRMKEEERKFVRGKNGKILRRDFFIFLLLVVVGYCGYCLYDIDYFHIREKLGITNKAVENIKDIDIEVPAVYDSAYYIENYGYLVDNMQINDAAVNLLYSGNVFRNTLTNDLKLKIAYKNLTNDKKSHQNGMITFQASDLLASLKKILGNDIEIENNVFSYNSSNFMYYDGVYLGLETQDTQSTFVYKIYDAKSENNNLSFSVLVGRIHDNFLYNYDDNLVLEEFDSSDLLPYRDRLSKFTYTFEKVDDSYYFKSITML